MDTAELPLVRDCTWDAAIRSTVGHDYPSLPRSFAAGEVLLDVGCHTGGVCELAVRRGATVVGIEANRENHALAVVNLAPHSSVTVSFGAVWRSDLEEAVDLLFTPNADPANTGGGSVLFGSAEDHWSALPAESSDEGTCGVLSSHRVPTIALDAVLSTLLRVRFLKLDVEGAEYPILLTSRRLDLVDAIAGEYHEFTDAQMLALVPSARVGDERYRGELLRRTLEDAGFVVTLRPGNAPRRGYFAAERRS